MDFRDVHDHMWNTYPLAVLERLRFDVRKKPFAVAPAVHFCMGGVEINEEGETGVPGLYACGEVTWGIHGANRRGGNALTECVVMGTITGKSAARHRAGEGKVAPKRPPEKTDGKNDFGRNSLSASLRELRTRLRNIAWEHGGIIRDQESMAEGLRKLKGLEHELQTVSWTNITERATREDLVSAVFSLRAILTSGMERKESRGSFIRRDFQKEDNTVWRKNSCLTYDQEENSFSVTYHSIQ